MEKSNLIRRRACYCKSSSVCRNHNGLDDHLQLVASLVPPISSVADAIYVTCVLFQTLSSWATSSVEEVNSVGPGIRFFQLYVCVVFAKV